MSRDFSMFEWRKYKEFYTIENGKIIFSNNTPSYILESYQKEQDQKEALNRFAERKDLNHRSRFFSKKNKESLDLLSNAFKFAHALEHNEPVETTWFSSRPIFIRWDGTIQTNPAQFRLDGPVYCSKSIKNKAEVILFFEGERFQSVLAITCDNRGKMVQIQEYRAKIIS